VAVELAWVRLTVNWPLSVGVSLAAASLAVIDTVALSLSAIVTVAASLGEAAITYPKSALVSVRMTDSVSSATVSSNGSTVMTAVVFPLRMITVPDVAPAAMRLPSGRRRP